MTYKSHCEWFSSSWMLSLSGEMTGQTLIEKALNIFIVARWCQKNESNQILDLLDYSRASSPMEGKEEVDMNEVISEFNSPEKIISEKCGLPLFRSNLPTLHSHKSTNHFKCSFPPRQCTKYSVAGISPIIEIKGSRKSKGYGFSWQTNGIGIDPQFYWLKSFFPFFSELHNKDQYSGNRLRSCRLLNKHVAIF